MENILSRISLISDNEGIKITSLERKIGASKGVLSRAISNKTDIQAKWVQKIVENYPQYNANWLLTGEEHMLKNDIHIYNVSSPPCEPAALPTINEPHHCVYRELYEKGEAKLEAAHEKIGELKAELRAEKKSG